GADRRLSERRQRLRRRAARRRLLGVDEQRLRRLPGLRVLPLRRLLEELVRHRLQGAARRLVGDAAGGGARHLPQLGLPDPPPDLRRLPAGARSRQPEGRGRLATMVCPRSVGVAVEPPVTVEVRRRPDAEEERRELLAALRARPRSIPSKHFYDERGLALFDEITELAEYYPTRTERAILERVAPAVARATGAAELVELGSGSATKTRLLLDALHARGKLRLYVP